MRLFSDLSQTTLSVGIGSGDTSCSVVALSSSGPPPYTFPAYASGNTFVATLVDATTGTQIEEVLVTNWDVGTNAISAMTRGYNGTTPKVYLAGDLFVMRITSDAMNNAAYIDQQNTFTAAQTGVTESPGDNSTKFATTAFVTTALSGVTIPLNYIAGLTMSTDGGSITMSIAAGECADSDSSIAIILASAISKTTAAWVAGSGNGGLDTGSIAASTWYYLYAIYDPTGPLEDVIFSLSSSSPALPSGYTSYRYIGGGLTDSSSKWVAFTQIGREFWLSSPIADFGGAGSTTASLLTLSVPRGRKIKWFGNITGQSTTYVSDPANADLAPSVTYGVSPGNNYYEINSTNSVYIPAKVWTNTSAQIRHREVDTNSIYMLTLGWLDLANGS